MTRHLHFKLREKESNPHRTLVQGQVASTDKAIPHLVLPALQPLVASGPTRLGERISPWLEPRSISLGLSMQEHHEERLAQLLSFVKGQVEHAVGG